MKLRLLTIAALVLATVVSLSALGGSGDAAFPGTNGPIVFTSFDDDQVHLFSRPAGGGERTQLTDADGVSDFDPAASPDGATVAFSRGESPGIPDIWLMDIDGSNERIVPNTQAGNHPAWSPDGDQLLFDDGFDIFVINLDGSGKTNLTEGIEGNATQPDWSPAGTQIAFAVTTFTNADIWVMDADGGFPSPRTSADDSVYNLNPEWSPTGKIAYTENDFGESDADIITMLVDGSDNNNLTHDKPSRQTNPAWSPDGTKIAYEQATLFVTTGVHPAGFSPTQINVMDADGTNTLDITDNTSLTELHPEWAVDAPPATPTPEPTDTPPPGDSRIWGDVDCSGAISSRDGQALLRNVLSQPPLSQTEPCPDIGLNVTVDGTLHGWGDLDCNSQISARDNQALLRNILSQAALGQTEPCPDIGVSVEVSGG